VRPLLQAEQAVLGAVLLDPDQLDRLDWLEPAHFYRPAHAELFAALRHLHAQGQPVRTAEGDVPLTWVSDAVAEASQHVHGLTAVYAHTLVSACPRPRHAPVYGRMVLEGAIHRTVTEHAVRLHQVARADQARGGIDTTLHHADVLAAVLEDLSRRWGTEPRPTAATPPTPAHQVTPGTAEVSDDEQLLLAALVERPDGMDEVAGWLRPSDFADPAHGHLYRCLGALRHRGEPVDRLTLLWEAQRRGLLADGTLTCEQITAVCDGIGPGSPQWLGERVVRTSLLRATATAARTIRDLAATDALPPGQLINQALGALTPLDDIRQRWNTGTQPPAPPPPPQLEAPGTAPPRSQVRAARSRSSPPTTPMPPTPPRPAAATVRPPARSHP
jgi:replicative DNA helicase